MNNLKNKIALVTGSAKNLGRAIALDLAKQGAKIIVHYQTSKQEEEKTLDEVKIYSEGIIVKADLTREKEVFNLFQTVKKEMGSVNILVNMIGNFIFEPITSTTFPKFKDVIESNLYSTFLCCQQALPHMQKNKWGRIINFGCVGADNLTIREKTTPYYIAKTGVIMLTKVLAYEYAKGSFLNKPDDYLGIRPFVARPKCQSSFEARPKYGVTINSISPGILQTSVAKPKTPSGKLAQFEDIINAINFLLKDESNYINGANLEVAGGWRPGYSGL